MQRIPFDHERLYFGTDIGYRVVLLATERRVAEIRAEIDRTQEA